MEGNYKYRHKVTYINIEHPDIINGKLINDLLIYPDYQKLSNK